MHLIVVFILLLRGVTPLNLPGSKCPEVPPSHVDPKSSSLNSVIYSIPFSPDIASHLFREMTKKDIDEERFLIGIGDTFKQRFESLRVRDGHFDKGRVSSEVLSFDNKSYTLTSNIQNNKMREEKFLCETPIIEKVHFWQEAFFLFLWSCVEGKREDWHEEALLIIADVRSENRTEEKVRRVARKYVTQDLVDLINFEDPLEHIGQRKYFYICPQSVLDPKAALTVVLSVVVVISVIGTGIYFYSFKVKE